MTTKKAILFGIYFIVGLCFLFVLIKGFLSFEHSLSSKDSYKPTPPIATIKDTKEEGKTIFTSLSNVTFENLSEVEYSTKDEKKSFYFEKGSNIDTSGCVEIKSYSFGDLNKDGAGDAVVLLGQYAEASCVMNIKDTVYAILNLNGILKTRMLEIKVEAGENFVFKAPEIRNGLVEVAVSSDDGKTFKTEKLQLINDTLVVPKEIVNSKIYRNTDFGFKISYPQNLFLSEREIVEDGKTLKGSLVISIDVPFLEKFNVWRKKNISLFVKQGACPVRNIATKVERNGLDFYQYDPEVAFSSDLTSVKKIREYMIYRAPSCFIFISSIEGLGPKHPQFPKPEDVTKPENEELFLKLEMVPLEQIFDTFSFIK